MTDDTTNAICDIATAIASKEAVLFIGAGISCTSGAPTWNDLIEELRIELRPPTKENNPLLVAQFYKNQFGDHALKKKLRDKFSNPQLKPSPTHRTICSMPVNVIFTTNYDKLLEDTFRELSKPYNAFFNDKEMALWDENNSVQIVKLHGDIDNSSSIVLCDEDYLKFVSKDSAIKRKLLDIFSYRTVIFIGYSLRDYNISNIYNLIYNEFGGLKRPAYILCFNEDPHLAAEWKRKGINPVIIPQTPNTTKSDATSMILKDIWKKIKLFEDEQRCDLLIVEDDPSFTSALKDFIESSINNIKVNIAYDGMEASFAICNLRPRILWVDIMMPRMDGFQLIEYMRQYSYLNDTKIIICTGHANSDTTVKATELNVNHFLTKPVEPSEAISIIQNLLMDSLHKEMCS